MCWNLWRKEVKRKIRYACISFYSFFHFDTLTPAQEEATESDRIYFMRLKIVMDLFQLSATDSFKASMFKQSTGIETFVERTKRSLALKLNKVIKSAMRIGINSRISLDTIQAVISLFPSLLNPEDLEMTLLPSQITSEDFFSPVFLVRLITGHSGLWISIFSYSLYP